MMKLKVLVVALALMSFGCGDDETPENNRGNNTSNNGTNNSNNGGDIDNTGMEFGTGYQFRFDSIGFDKGTAGFGLNGILASNLNTTLEYPVVILIDMKEVDIDAGTFQLRGGAGLKAATEGEFSWDPAGLDSYVPATLVERSGAFDGVLEQLDFIATITTELENVKVTIPIKELKFTGGVQLADGGATGTIPNGRIEGYLTKTDGDATEIQVVPGGTPVSITNLFKEAKLNYDSVNREIVEEGTGDAWFLTGGFTAIPTTIVP